MRIAAGILMVFGGLGILALAGYYLTQYFTRHLWWTLVVDPFVLLFLTASGGLAVAGGILALKKRLWGFCLASSMLVIWIILPPVFVYVTRSEWKS